MKITSADTLNTAIAVFLGCFLVSATTVAFTISLLAITLSGVAYESTTDMLLLIGFWSADVVVIVSVIKIIGKGISIIQNCILRDLENYARRSRDEADKGDDS